MPKPPSGSKLEPRVAALEQAVADLQTTVSSIAGRVGALEILAHEHNEEPPPPPPPPSGSAFDEAFSEDF